VPHRGKKKCFFFFGGGKGKRFVIPLLAKKKRSSEVAGGEKERGAKNFEFAARVKKNASWKWKGRRNGEEAALALKTTRGEGKGGGIA